MLSDTAIRKAKPGDKPQKMHDAQGLYLLLTPAGGKLWRYDYRWQGKRKTLALGRYPQLSLAAARQAREQARQQLEAGADPAQAKQQQKAKRHQTLQAWAETWWESASREWSLKHSNRLRRLLERDLYPALGDEPIDSISTPQIEEVLQTVAGRSVEMAKRLQTALNQIYSLACRRGVVRYDPMPALRGVLPSVRYQHMPAPTNPQQVGRLLLAIDGYEGHVVTKHGLCLAPLVFVRPGELRKGKWQEIDWDNALWRIPGERIKQGRDHMVPLSRQALAVLDALHFVTGRGDYLFPSMRTSSRPMSDGTLNAALRRLGYSNHEITSHGFRAMARTMIHEQLGYDPEAIEAQLAHAVPDRLGRAYNRTQHLATRIDMMQAWTDYLDRLKAAAQED